MKITAIAQTMENNCAECGVHEENPDKRPHDGMKTPPTAHSPQAKSRSAAATLPGLPTSIHFSPVWSKAAILLPGARARYTSIKENLPVNGIRSNTSGSHMAWQENAFCISSFALMTIFSSPVFVLRQPQRRLYLLKSR